MLNTRKIKDVITKIDKLKDTLEDVINDEKKVNLIQNAAIISDDIALKIREESIIASSRFPIFNTENKSVELPNDNYFIRKIWNNSFAFCFPEIPNFKLIERLNGKKIEKKLSYTNSVLKDKILQFCLENKIKTLNEKYVLYIINVVAEDVPDAYISDTDNRNYTDIINVFKQFFFKDDSYKHISYSFNTVKKGNKNKTIAIIIQNEDDFIAFREIKYNLLNLIDLENYKYNSNNIIKFEK